MSTNPCIADVQRAAGRELSDDELTLIFTQAQRTARRELNRLPGAGAMADDQRQSFLWRTTQRTVADIVHKIELDQRRAALAMARRLDADAAIAAHPDGPARGLLSLLIKDKADRGRTLSIEDRARAITKATYARLVDTFERLAPRWLGLMDQPGAQRGMVRAIFREDLSRRADLSPELRAELPRAADAWHAAAQALRDRFNTAGGDIGQRSDWHIPMSHSQERVRRTPVNEWVEFVLERVDRSKYLHVDGSAMDAPQIRELLTAAHDTISTGGVLPTPPRGPGMIAKRHADPRVIHWRNADAWLDYQERFSDRTVAGIMADHIESLARDIALTEVFGPNPHHQFAMLRQQLVAGGASGRDVSFLDSVFAHLTGSANKVAWQSAARTMQIVRNLQVAAKLGAAVLSSVTDFASSIVTARFNRLPFLRHLDNIITSFNPLSQDDVRLAQRAGLGLDTLVGELNRWADDNMGGGWSAKTASAVLRASGLQAFTEAGRRAFSATMMSTLGHLSRTPWEALDEADRAHLSSYGITPTEWAALRRVELEDWGGGNNTMLTPEAIGRLSDEALGATGQDAARLRNELVTKTLGMTLSEESHAVVTPGVRERALMLGESKKGTVGGEFRRSLFLFKSFPIAVIAKHWMRGFGQRTVGGKAAYLASYVVGSTVLGALAVQFKDLSKGREPREMDNKEFWIAAFLQGGGAGLFGDFVVNDSTRYGNSFTETLAGPVASTVQDVFNVTIGNMHQAARGEPTDAGAEALRLIQSNTPGLNVWYLRAAFDHLIFHELQEWLSPGYLRRMKERVKEETGRGFWWEPGG